MSSGSLLDKIVDKLRNLGSGMRGGAIATLVAFFGYTLYQSLHCAAGVSISCMSIQNFGIVFPLYVIVMPFVSHINLVSYVLLYIISSAIYSILAYQVLGWLGQMAVRTTRRPVMSFRKITDLPTSGNLGIQT